MIIEFRVRFHAPFRIASGSGSDGKDLAVDGDEPLNASHIKGRMKASCRTVLGLDEATIEEVFGSVSSESPWTWMSARSVSGWDTSGTRHRVAVDPVTHTAIVDHLVRTQYVVAETATFQVEAFGAIPADRLPVHAAVIRCSGAAVHEIGGWRRRGLGWVGIEVTGDNNLDTDLDILAREGAA